MSQALPTQEEILSLLQRESLTTSQLRGRFNITKKHKLSFKAMLLDMVDSGVLGRNEKKQYVVGKPKKDSGYQEVENVGSGRPASRSRRQAAQEDPFAAHILKGTLVRIDKQWFVREQTSQREFRIPNRKRPPGEDGQVVVFELYPHPKYKHELLAKITANLSDFGSFSALVRKFQNDANLPENFPDAVEKEIASMAEPVESDFKDRVDYRNLHVVCIDPEGARDHDDAISIEPLKKGGWRLGVHIADVSHYVRENGPLDHEAIERSFTQYLPWVAIPMLPEKLSAELCSLNEGVDRLAHSCMMELDAKGNVLNWAFEKVVIRVTRSISYESAQQLFDDADEDIIRLATVARLLRGQREASGILELGSPEYRVVFDDKGNPQQVVPRENLESCSWIEECMLIANQCCARELVKRSLQGIYRIHEAPDLQDIQDLYYADPGLFQKAPVLIKEIGDTRRGDSNLNPAAFALYRHMIQVAQGDDQRIFRILRSMQKAHYDSNPFGHFALNWQDYAHFTSPIRRYADLWCHRELSRRGREIKAPRAHDIVEVCDVLSANEIKNQKIERTALKLCSAWMLREHIGDEFDGMISGMEEWGIYVRLDHPPCEGLVRFRELPFEDYWYFNRDKGCVVGRRSRKTWWRGDRVKVMVLNVNPLRGEVDLSVTQKLESVVDASGEMVEQPSESFKALKTKSRSPKPRSGSKPDIVSFGKKQMNRRGRKKN